MERIDIDCKIDDPRGGDPDPNSYRTLNMNHYVRMSRAELSLLLALRLISRF